MPRSKISFTASVLSKPPDKSPKAFIFFTSTSKKGKVEG
jgi:hypothetical protein